MKKDFKQMMKRLRKMGADVATGQRHCKITHPDTPGVTVTIPSTPSDWRALLNSKASIKRYLGLEI